MGMEYIIRVGDSSNVGKFNDPYPNANSLACYEFLKLIEVNLHLDPGIGKI